MTEQSLPISRTRKDYIYSAIVVILLASSATLLVYLTRSSEALIMKQPRMTVVVSLSLIMFFTAFIFISRSPLPFFSRPLAYGSVVLSAIAMGALWIFHSEGNDSGWFRFTILCLTVTVGSTILAEIMIFYRKFFADRSWRTKFEHKVVFSLVIALLTFSMGYFYYDLAVSGGAILEDPTISIPQDTGLEQQLPDGLSPDLSPDGLLGQEDQSNSGVVDPDSPVSTEEETSDLP